MKIKLKWVLCGSRSISVEYGGIWELRCGNKMVGQLSLSPNDDSSIEEYWLGSGDTVEHLTSEVFEYENESGHTCRKYIEDTTIEFFELCFPDCTVTIDRAKLVELLDTNPEDLS
jgi:hypothetical protein